VLRLIIKHRTGRESFSTGTAYQNRKWVPESGLLLVEFAKLRNVRHYKEKRTLLTRPDRLARWAEDLEVACDVTASNSPPDLFWWFSLRQAKAWSTTVI
jgi:hypothetical protein